GFGQRVLHPLARKSGQRVAGILPHNLIRKVDQLLLMADEPWSLPGFVSVWALSALAGVGLFVYIALTSTITPLQLVGLGVVVIPFPALIPYALLRRRALNRQKQITRTLPDALDLLTTCVEAGMAVDAAFALVVDRTEGALSETFALYLKQVGLGRARRDALAYVANRTGVPDLVAIAAAINQGEELGTTLGDVLRLQANDLRALRRQRAQEAAQRAPVLMTIPLALCFLPAMGAVVVVPSILNLINFVGGLG
ncbi:MAG: type II secretion system F family protein, partial [Dehalococcoidia bacterium]|nr:type II secretion system F family protein [Dehalococcoidia bacterium]